MKSVTHFTGRQLKERKKKLFQKFVCVMRLMNSRFVGFLAAEVQPSAWGLLGVVLGVEGRGVGWMRGAAGGVVFSIPPQTRRLFSEARLTHSAGPEPARRGNMVPISADTSLSVCV